MLGVFGRKILDKPKQYKIMQKIVILGVSGMLGSVVFDFFSKNAQKNNLKVIGVDRKTLDAQNFEISQLEKLLTGASFVINCIGIIKPYIKDDNAFETKRAIEVNSLFPHKLALVAEKTGARVLQIATDCVYDGAKGLYIESDKHNALDVYGKSKSLGEVYSNNLLNIRCSIIGPEVKGKVSLLEWFLGQNQGVQVNGFTNHLWNGVTTLAFAKICLGIIKENIKFNHLQHIVPQDIVTKANMLHTFAKAYNRADIKINEVKAGVVIDRTLATSNKQINDEIWLAGGYKHIPTVAEMIKEIANYGRI
jgi:dTDP-4-dehydrorhamnose reductase